MVLSVIIPIFLLLAFGYLTVKLNLLSKEQVGTVGAFVIKIALPALFLQSLAAKDLHEVWLPELFYTYTIATVIMFSIAMVVMRRYFHDSQSHAAVLALGASMSNTGLIGTAVLTLLIGHAALTYTSLIVILESVLLVPAVLVLASLNQQGNMSVLAVLKQTVFTLLKNPLFMGVSLGILCAIFEIRLPHYLSEVLALIGQSASPLALFSIGGGIVGLTLKYVNLQSLYLVISNNFVFPLLVFCGLNYVVDAPQQMVYVGTIIAALPMPTIFGILGQAYGLNDKAITPLLISTIVGFINTTILITIWWS